MLWKEAGLHWGKKEIKVTHQKLQKLCVELTERDL